MVKFLEHKNVKKPVDRTQNAYQRRNAQQADSASTIYQQQKLNVALKPAEVTDKSIFATQKQTKTDNKTVCASLDPTKS